eukprot:9475118-Pyramimonas_sp.AAC.1
MLPGFFYSFDNVTASSDHFPLTATFKWKCLAAQNWAAIAPRLDPNKVRDQDCKVKVPKPFVSEASMCVVRWRRAATRSARKGTGGDGPLGTTYSYASFLHFCRGASSGDLCSMPRALGRRHSILSSMRRAARTARTCGSSSFELHIALPVQIMGCPQRSAHPLSLAGERGRADFLNRAAGNARTSVDGHMPGDEWRALHSLLIRGGRSSKLSDILPMMEVPASQNKPAEILQTQEGVAHNIQGAFASIENAQELDSQALRDRHNAKLAPWQPSRPRDKICAPSVQDTGFSIRSMKAGRVPGPG